MAEIVSFPVTRSDGVTFVYDKFSPNGTQINSLTAHNDYWASVPVGRFDTAAEAFEAVENFVMVKNKAAKQAETLSYETLLAEEALILDVQMKIQGALNSKGMSQSDLAIRMGVSESYVSQMFGSAARNLTLRTAARVMKALDLVPSISTR